MNIWKIGCLSFLCTDSCHFWQHWLACLLKISVIFSMQLMPCICWNKLPTSWLGCWNCICHACLLELSWLCCDDIHNACIWSAWPHLSYLCHVLVGKFNVVCMIWLFCTMPVGYFVSMKLKIYSVAELASLTYSDSASCINVCCLGNR